MRKRSTYGETERIRVDELKDEPAPIDEVDDEITKPHDLPVLSSGDLDSPATGHDVLVLWNRMDKHVRSRRATDRNQSGRMKSMQLKLRIIWTIGAFLLAGLGASLYTTAKFLYSRGGEEAIAANTLKTVVEAQSDHGRRLRVVEDALIRLLQKLEDTPSRNRDRHDAITGSSTKGTK